MAFAKSILSLIIATQLLVASLGFTLNSHYCMGRLMDTALIKSARSCLGMEEMEMDIKMDCCEDTSEIIKTDDTSLTKIQESPQPVVTVVWVHVFWVLVKETLITNNSITNNQLRLPPLIRDIPILIQSFRI